MSDKFRLEYGGTSRTPAGSVFAGSYEDRHVVRLIYSDDRCWDAIETKTRFLADTVIHDVNAVERFGDPETLKQHRDELLNALKRLRDGAIQYQAANTNLIDPASHADIWLSTCLDSSYDMIQKYAADPQHPNV